MGKNKRQKSVGKVYIYLYRGNLSTRVEYRRIKRRGVAFASSFFFLFRDRCQLNVAQGLRGDTRAIPAKHIVSLWKLRRGEGEGGDHGLFFLPAEAVLMNRAAPCFFRGGCSLMGASPPPDYYFANMVEYGWFGEERNWNCLDTGRKVFKRGVINSWRLPRI